MLLSEVFEQLTFGELSNLKIGGKAIGDIEAEQYPELMAHVNMGLTALHKVFNLSTKELILQQSTNINLYFLKKQFAVNGGSAELVKYIVDTAADPFEDILLKVTKVVDEDGDPLFVDEVTEETSLYLPTYNSLQVPNPTSSVLGVTYRARHKTISPVNLVPEDEEVIIPESLLEPLLYYIASRAFAGTPAMNGVDRSAQYWGRYQNSLGMVKKEGLIHIPSAENTRLEDNGWV